MQLSNTIIGKLKKEGTKKIAGRKRSFQESHGLYHTPSDTIDKISSSSALKNGQLGMAVLAQVAAVLGVTHNT